MQAECYDVVVVGAGASGSALAARLSEDPGRSVLLIEAGPVPCAEADFPDEILDAGSMRGAAPDHPLNWNYPSQLRDGRAWGVARGRGLGGSTAINGGYFVRAHPRDFDDWAARTVEPGAGPSAAQASPWSYQHALPLLQALETDLDYPGAQGHGSSGPMQVQRAFTTRPEAGESGLLDAAFLDSAREHGFGVEADKNAGGAPGVGPVPMNAIGGVRRHAGLQYILPALERPNLTVRGGTRVLRLRFAGRRVTGLDVAPAEQGRASAAGARLSGEGSAATGIDAGSAQFISAGSVVLAAGAIATPQLLMLSGLGPAESLQELGVSVTQDLPGVGRQISDHPDISLPLRVKPGVGGSAVAKAVAKTAFTTGLNFSSSADDGRGDLELLLAARPLGALFGIEAEEAQRTYSLMLGLQCARSRGEIRLGSADPLAPPRIDCRFLSAKEDLAALREGLRTAFALLQSPGLAASLESLPELSPGHSSPGGSTESIGTESISTESILNDDAALDDWLRSNIGIRFHTCGGAAMGTDPEAGAVVDAEGHVYGVEGLRVADLSILPAAPSRGPANTAVFIGELIARAMT